MQYPVDAKAHIALLTTRLDVDIAGALLEGVLEQPIDDIDDMRVIGVRFLVAGSKVEQLLEVARAAGFLLRAAGAANRFGQAKKLDGQALNLHRVGYDTLDRQLQHMSQVRFPAGDMGLGTGDCHSVLIDCHGKNPVALGEGVGHQRRYCGDIDGQRVNAQVWLANLLRQPACQAFQFQGFAGAFEVGEPLAGDEFQWVLFAFGLVAAVYQCLFGSVLIYQALGNQFAQQLIEIQPAVLGCRGDGHAGSFKRPLQQTNLARPPGTKEQE
ncbi:hypothetical protein D9M71_114870 [compost metagenome]